MDELTQLIKKTIKYKFSSTRRFSEEIGIPQTTIVSSIKNGINGTAFSTVCKMCRALDIKLVDGIYPVVVSDTTKNIIDKLSKLDDKGIHTVATILEMEYVRCRTEADIVSVAEKNANEPIILTGEQIPSKSDISELLRSISE